MLRNIYKFFLLFFAVSCLFSDINAQIDLISPEETQETILRLDSIFWEAYNSCDTEKMKSFMTDDIEFYHDIGGLTTPLDKLMKSLEEGLCSNDDFSLRRASVAGTIQVYPMSNYGAIISGNHVFYVNQKGQQERLDGAAKFTHLWKYENETWKMSRILSYDHGPATTQNTRKMITLSDQVLQHYIGQYEAPETGIVSIQKEGAALRMTAGKMTSVILPESAQLFFIEDKALTFEFVEDDKGHIKKMIVRENGKIVEEAKKLAPK